MKIFGGRQEKLYKKVKDRPTIFEAHDSFDTFDIDTLDSGLQNLMVLDDIVLERDQKKFIELSRGRQLSISTIYISQSKKKKKKKRKKFFTLTAFLVLKRYLIFLLQEIPTDKVYFSLCCIADFVM